MIKKILYNIIFIGILTCFPILSQAQKRAELLGGGGTNFSDKKPDRNGLLTGTHSAVYNLFGFYTYGAYSTHLFTNSNICSMPVGHSYGGGLCYEFQYYYLKLQTGLGVRFQDITTSVYDFTFNDANVSDAWGYPYTLHYDFVDRIDHYKNVQFEIPLLVGSGDKNFYTMAGLKLTLNAASTTKVSSVGSTTATYEQFLGKFEEMDNHGLRKNVDINYSSSRLFEKPFLFDVKASIEFGGEIGTKYQPPVSRYRNSRESQRELQWRIRLAVFCDLSILPMPLDKSANELVTIPQDSKWDFYTFKMNYVHSINKPYNARLRDFYTGVKLTVFLGSLSYITCIICNDAQSEADMANPLRKGL